MFRILGDQDNLITDLDIQLFKDRDIFLDCRERIIIESNVVLGFGINILSQSHDLNNMDRVVPRPVIIREKAFIGSFSTLYNCEIGEGAVVACGSVVRNMKVPPRMIIEGNPAKIVRLRGGVNLHAI